MGILRFDVAFSFCVVVLGGCDGGDRESSPSIGGGTGGGTNGGAGEGTSGEASAGTTAAPITSNGGAAGGNGATGVGGSRPSSAQGGSDGGGSPPIATGGTSNGGMSSGGEGAEVGGEGAGGAAVDPNPGPCAGKPLNCYEICEGGSCDCGCSGSGLGCETPGWSATTLGWERFNLTGQTGAGLTVCHPESFTWTDPQPSANQPELNASVRITILAYAGVDQPGALDYVSSQDRANCGDGTVADYGVQFVRVGDWPAMERSYVAPNPVCGACETLPAETESRQADVIIAAGTHIFHARATAPIANPDALREFFEIAETMRVDNGQTPVDASADLVTLNEAHAANCE